MIEIKNLSIDFGRGPDRVRAVREMNLSIKKGETLAIVGESGSGKA